MHLVELPPEIVLLVIDRLESLQAGSRRLNHFFSLTTVLFQDLGALLLSCKTLYDFASNPNPDLLLRLASSPHSGIQPYPHLLLAIKARELSNWAVSDGSRHDELQRSIKGGCERLFGLAINVSPLTLDDIRRLHTARHDILIPLAEEMEPMYGPPSRLNDNFTICNNVMLALTNFWIYCDLFHHNISLLYSPDPSIKPLSTRIRADWLKYCVPDQNCDRARYPDDLEQVDIRWILPEMQAFFRNILDPYSFDVEFTHWWTRVAFHTGLTALSILQAKDHKSVPREIWEVKELVRRGIGQGIIDLRAGDLPWYSMFSDIRSSWTGWGWEE